MNAKPLKLISLASILNEPLPPPRWLVEPLISVGSRVVIYGAWGSYKSWGLVDLALHLAAGQPWLGKFPIPEPKRVLYVDEEMSERTLRRRIKRLSLGMETPDDPSRFQALSHHGVRLSAAGTNELLDGLKATDFDPDVVIVETLRRVLEGNENEARDVAAFWRSVDPILKAQKEVIVSHHMRKPNPNGSNQTRYQASGSTDILGGVDDALAFVRRAQDAFTVEHVKCRDGEEVEVFMVGLYEEGDAVILRHEGTQAHAVAQVSKTSQAEQHIEKFLQAAPDQTAKTNAILTHLDSVGIATRTGQAALTAMTEVGKFTQPKKKGAYQLVSK